MPLHQPSNYNCTGVMFPGGVLWSYPESGHVVGVCRDEITHTNRVQLWVHVKLVRSRMFAGSCGSVSVHTQACVQYLDTHGLRKCGT